jgi:hypothetical protein
MQNYLYFHATYVKTWFYRKPDIAQKPVHLFYVLTPRHLLINALIWEQNDEHGEQAPPRGTKLAIERSDELKRSEADCRYFYFRIIDGSAHGLKEQTEIEQ